MKSPIESKKIFVEVAKTPEQLSKGLMFRKKLDEDSGMLFVFDKPKDLSFWGMNTFMPLDIAFIDEEGVIKDIKRIKEHDLNSVKSSCPCKYALEISDGWFNKNNFQVGDYIESIIDNFSGYLVILKNKNKIKYAQKQEEIKEEDIDEKEEDLKNKKQLEVEKEKEKPPLVEVKKPTYTKPIQFTEIKEPVLQIPKFNNIFEAIRWSMGNLQVMRITYKTAKGHTVTKDVEPHSAFFSRSSKRQVLKAYDETADHPSQYIIMNISSYGFPGRKFVPKSILLNRRIT